MKTVIETESLGKRYGEIQAVEGLSLRVSEGEIYAFLGLNGAGKTTTIRMLLGMIHPTAGSATVLGTRVRMGSVEPWAAVGYMVEDPHAYGELTVRENLEVARRLHPGTPGKAVEKIIERLGWQPMPTGAPAPSRTGMPSAWDWPKPCSINPACSSWMSLPTGLTRRVSSRSASCC